MQSAKLLLFGAWLFVASLVCGPLYAFDAVSSAPVFSLERSWHAGFIRPMPGRPRAGRCVITAEGVTDTQYLGLEEEPVTRQLKLVFNTDIPDAATLIQKIQDAATGTIERKRGLPDVGSKAWLASLDGVNVTLFRTGMVTEKNQSASAALLRAFIELNCTQP